MIEIKDKKDCCGCAACESICKQNCITMVSDTEGFLYPKVDKTICIDCNMCEKVCPVLAKKDRREPLQTFAAKNKDIQTRRQSSSGGVFSLIASQVIEKGGKVYGAVFDENFDVCHSCIEKKEYLYLIRGSKYVQSNTQGIFPKVEKDLKEGKLVLFSGTPCHTAGLRTFLRKDYDNLILLDVVCHGVPSPKVWRLYLDKIRQGEKVTSVSFRDKAKGWNNSSITIKTTKRTISQVMFGQTYMKGFLKNLYLRPACHHCAFKGYKSLSDITLADFWGVEKEYKDFADRDGVSLVMINTLKGKEWLDLSKADSIETSLDFAVKNNSPIVSSVKPYETREYFFANIDKKPIDKLIEKSLARPWEDFKDKIKHYIVIVLRFLHIKKPLCL
ncbi:MAG: Coenzyme F420 hydrogenase/dehydrogenase, beta subunit C-terminal domain [Bacteroidales bacterium]|nr:Coenzyme F420 hydrogenase/dehydrogenase, beta subunit C-terminal domain [Bacteroidales bacterium]